MSKPDKPGPDCSDLDALEANAQCHAAPTPIIVRAILLGVREMRMLRAALAAPTPRPPAPPPPREQPSDVKPSPGPPLRGS